MSEIESTFIMALHLRGSDPEYFPVKFNAAYVTCFVRNKTIEGALNALSANLLLRSYELVEEVSEVYKLESSWEDYVKSEWSEYSASLPDADAAETLLSEGKVIYGPFAGYNSEN